MSGTHSPTPWRVYDDLDSDENVGIDDSYGEAVVFFGSNSLEGIPNRANADYIVLAVNSHADLLAACQAWLEFNKETAAENPCPDLGLRAVLRERAKTLSLAAIAKATGGAT